MENKVMDKVKCKCVESIQKQVVGTTQKGGIVKEATFLLVDLFSGRTISEIEVITQGKDKPKKSILNMIHSYCPFCGKRYNQKL